VLLISIGTGTLAGAVLCSQKVTILYLENRDRSRACWMWVNPSERFSISYIHSIYKEPATEEFQIEQGKIVLRGVRASHAGILEYYGFGDTNEFHPMNRRFGSIFLRVGMSETQKLWVRDKKVSLGDIGERGDQIQLGVRSVSLGRYLFHLVFPDFFNSSFRNG
jgi:hypothetical protein